MSWNCRTFRRTSKRPKISVGRWRHHLFWPQQSVKTDVAPSINCCCRPQNCSSESEIQQMALQFWKGPYGGSNQLFMKNGYDHHEHQDIYTYNLSVPRRFTLRQAIGRGWRRKLQQIFKLGFSMLHPFVLPQPLFRSICIVTLVTGKRGNLRGLPLLDEWKFLIFFTSPQIIYLLLCLINHKCVLSDGL